MNSPLQVVEVSGCNRKEDVKVFFHQFDQSHLQGMKASLKYAVYSGIHKLSGKEQSVINLHTYTKEHITGE